MRTYLVVHVLGHAFNFYAISTQPSDDLPCYFPEYPCNLVYDQYCRTDILPKFDYWLWRTVTGKVHIGLGYLERGEGLHIGLGYLERGGVAYRPRLPRERGGVAYRPRLPREGGEGLHIGLGYLERGEGAYKPRLPRERGGCI